MGKPPIEPPSVLSLDNEARRLISAYQLARTHADHGGPDRPIFETADRLAEHLLKSNGVRLDQHPDGF